MTTIVLHGFLGEKYGKEVNLAGNTIQKLMAGLKARFGPQFKEDIRTHDWHLVKGNLDTAKDAIDASQIEHKLNTEVLHFIPVMIGAAKKFAQIIVGIILVVVGAIASAYGYGAIGGPMMKVGWAMIIGGVINYFFAPKPPSGSDKDESPGSYVFNGAVNITTQGGAKPLVFGQIRAGAVVVSSDFSTDVIPNNTNTDTGTGSTDEALPEYVIDVSPGGE